MGKSTNRQDLLSVVKTKKKNFNTDMLKKQLTNLNFTVAEADTQLILST